MNQTPRILAFAGSTRTESFNKKLLKVAVRGAEEAGAEAKIIDFREFPLPIFDQDLETKEGLPANGRKLKDLFLAHDGLLISTPEYNSSISGVLKNAIDWVSRPEPGKPSLGCFLGKVAALMAASPGTLGGLRGLVHLRAILENINVIVLPDQVAVSKASEAFAPDGSLKDAKQQESVMNLGRELARVVGKLKQ